MEKGVRAEHDENEREQNARDDGEDFHGPERARIYGKIPPRSFFAAQNESV